MKKRIFGRKLSRERDSRRALFRGLMKALITYGSIKTTKAKALAVRPEVERLVNKAKLGGLNNRRLISALFGNDRETADKVFKEIVDLFKDRKSGFVRMLNLPQRRGDSAKMVRLEWSEKIESGKKQVVSSKDDKKKTKEIVKKDIAKKDKEKDSKRTKSETKSRKEK